MPVRRDNLPAKGPRPFTNREDKIKLFWKRFDHMLDREYNILSFWGVGGVGKSRLQQELKDQIKYSPWAKETIISSVLDFDTRDNRPSMRDLERALFGIRSELTKVGVPFRAFDIAYAHYWEQTHPEVALQQKDIPFINEGSAIIDLFSGAKDLSTSVAEFSTWIVGAGILPKALTLLSSLHKAGQNWLTERAVSQLQQLNGMSVGQLLKELVYFLALDIRSYLEKSHRRLVIFIDTYEALWWDAPQSRSLAHKHVQDEWIRDLLTELPNTLCIITGRDKLGWTQIEDWSQWVDEIPMTELSDPDSGKYLLGCEIVSSEIINRIKQSSLGLPFALELQVDQYERIIQKRQPTINDFTDRSDKIVQRFTEYLTLEERQTLNLLSVVRVWDLEIFQKLIRHFQTGYPATALPELSQFSFITRDGDYYRMHALMREELRERLDKSLLLECHRFLFQYYHEKFDRVESKDISAEQEFALEEALYHQINVVGIEQAVKWFVNAVEQFDKGGRWNLCLRLALELKSKWNNEVNFTYTINYSNLILRIGSFLHSQCIYEQALYYYQTALSIVQQLLGDEHPDVAIFLSNIGLVYYAQGKYDQALDYDQKALFILQQELGDDHLDTATPLNNIGLIYNALGQYRQALGYYQQALNIRREILGDKHPDTANSLNNIGGVYRNQAQYEQALSSYQEALDIRRKVLGDEHPDTATSLNNIGGIYDYQGQYEQALEYHLKALSIRRQVLGDEHPSIANSLGNIGSVYQAQGQYEQALDCYRKALSIFQQVLGDEHPDNATTLSNIGSVYLAQSQYEQALGYYQKALSIRRQVLGDKHPDTASSLNDVSNIYYTQGQYDQALEYYQKALIIWRQELEEQHPAIATALNNIGQVYNAQGQYEQALDYHQKALSTWRQVLQAPRDEHPDIANSLNNIGGVYRAQGHYDKALEYYQMALRILKKILGDKHLYTASIINNMGSLYHSQDQYEQALDYYQKALSIRRQVLGDEHLDTATTLNTIGLVHHAQSQYEQALEYQQKALSIFIKLLGDNHPRVIKIIDQMIASLTKRDQADKSM